jgi:hypothetical protein
MGIMGRRLLIVISLLLVATGICFRLLLNGQHFTNGVWFILCLSGSALAWLLLAVQQPTSIRWAIVVLHILAIGLSMRRLPEEYEWQRQFNDRRNRRGMLSRADGEFLAAALTGRHRDLGRKPGGDE